MTIPETLEGRVYRRPAEKLGLVMPENRKLWHSIVVLKFQGFESKRQEDVAEYCILRCQNIQVPQALRQFRDEPYTVVIRRDGVSNAVSILNECKAILRKAGIQYTAWGGNKIRTSASQFERVLNQLLDGDLTLFHVSG